MKVTLPIGYRANPVPGENSFIKEVEIKKISTPGLRKVNQIMNKRSRGKRMATEVGMTRMITECCQIGDEKMDRKFWFRGRDVSPASLLTTEDRTFLLTEIRKLTLGSSKIETKYTCENCSPPTVIRFRGEDAESFDDLEVTKWAPGEEKTSIGIILEDDPFAFNGKEYCEMEFGLILGYMDELLFEKFGDDKSSRDVIGIIQFYIGETFERFADADEETNKEIMETSIDLIPEFISVPDLHKIRDSFREEMPGLNLRDHDVVCPECGEYLDEDAARFDISNMMIDFFTGLKKRGKSRNSSRRRRG